MVQYQAGDTTGAVNRVPCVKSKIKQEKQKPKNKVTPKTTCGKTNIKKKKNKHARAKTKLIARQ